MTTAMQQHCLTRPLWPLVFVVAFVGAKGCPTQMGCSVSGNLPNRTQQLDASTWTCQVGVTLAKGTSITSPGAAKSELLAKKEAATVQVASLREQVSQTDERGYGFAGKDPGSPPASADQDRQLTQKISQLEGETEKINQQVQAIESIHPPTEATVLTEGAWIADGSTVTFQTVAPYSPGQKFVVPYVIRSDQGDILETGFLPVQSIRVEGRR